MKMKYLFFLIIILSMLSLSGCWDYLELADRGIIYAIALDKVVVKKEHHEKEGFEIGESREKESSEREDAKGKKQYMVTLQLIEPTFITGAERKGFSKSSYWNVATVKADTISGAIEEINSRIYRRPFLSHVRVILIGEELARGGVTSSLDYLVRDPYIRKGTPIIVTKGLAKDVLNVEHRSTTLSGIYLAEITKSAKYNGQTPELDLGDLSLQIHEGNNFTAPRVILSEAKNDLKYGGAAVFKKDKLVGWLGEREVQDWGLLVEKFADIPISVACPTKDDNGVFNVQIISNKRNYNVEYKNGRIFLKVKIFVAGNLKEMQCQTCEMMNVKETNLMEAATAKSIENRIEYTFEQVQKKFGIDIYMMGDYIHKFHPDIWKQVSKNWDKHFAEMKLDVEAESFLRTAGAECRPDLQEHVK